MNNSQGEQDGFGAGSDGGSSWFVGGEPPTSYFSSGVFEEPQRRSVLVPVLVGVLCLLVVVVVVGALVLFLQRDKGNVVKEASVESSSAMTSITQLPDSAAPEVKSEVKSEEKQKPVTQPSSGSGTRDTSNHCTDFPLSANERLAFSKDEAERLSNGYKNPVTLVSYCDGEWAQLGQWGSSLGDPMHWNGSRWESVAPDEPVSFGERGACWWRSNLLAQGASQTAVDNIKVPYCEEYLAQDPSSSGGSSGSGSGSSHTVSGIRNPECDGRYILIAESVVVTDGQDPQAAVNSRLANYPGAYVAEPGACPSLRAIEPNTGGEIYPIYYDYGFDLNAVCSAWGTKGPQDDVRILTNVQGDYRNPC